MKALLVLLMLAGSASAQVFVVEDQGPPPRPPLLPPPPRWFASVSSGSGFGVIGGETEGVGADVATGPQWAPLHVRVELGLIRNKRWSAAVAARLGFPLLVDVGDPPIAKSAMAKVYRSFGPLRFHVGAGGGYLRYRVGVDNVAHDVMAAGPILVGSGAGYVLELSPSWRLVVDANLVGAIAFSDKYKGVRNEHALHAEIDIGFALFR